MLFVYYDILFSFVLVFVFYVIFVIGRRLRFKLDVYVEDGGEEN